ncbi:protein involved in gliding motility EpsB [Flavobacterium croceum DSM 17960]|uniref:non-specific protein-tyrosine kinase n=1 Tax=Flavobacterium croceum DSM 17960 TaxID=1121886 RepID=A0A2S4N9L3_9FLAO|nr:tyrosine-protein kinase family protein [Flavobacterium croceum]POS02370.1 protein involved in gliding motility EpsB [Flavobacterium croceum DSM 17960]
MLDIKDFSFLENQNSFDFKGFLLKTLSYWKWFVLGVTLCLFVAHQVNIRKQKIYELETTIAVKEQDNPLFTSNTSLVFNWGGASDQVQSISTTLKSRSHNELVVDKLDFYIDYLEEKEYFTEDVYGYTPFVVKLQKDKNQLYQVPFKVKFLTTSTYQITADFNNLEVPVINYITNQVNTQKVASTHYEQTFKLGQNINIPFLNATLEFRSIPDTYVGKEYIVQFNSFDNTVSKYRNVRVAIDEKAASILKLSMDGTNKKRIVDYLNATVNMLIKRQLDAKNLFADNTVKFIDTTLTLMEKNLKDANNELKNFNRNKDFIEIEKGGEGIQSEIKELDVLNDEINRKVNYYNTLRNYLLSSNDYSKLPAPAVAGIDDPNIVMNVSNIIDLSVQRSEMAYSVKSKVMFEDVDNKISALKRVLLENIATAKNAIQFDSRLVRTKINKAESKISTLPQDKQEYFQIMRKYDLSSTIYETYLQKRSEALIVKAANLSDIQFIDPAKDIGGGLIGPKTSVNYVMAIFVGLFIPLLVVFIIFFINNSIQNTDDIAKQTNIPIIGIVGTKKSEGNLAVFEKPKSALSESFRAIRSSLQFLYKKQQQQGGRTLMLTSSVSGEGKTFCSMNIATVFAMSDKKTVVIGLDMRKPKLFDDFGVNNNFGVVNYLIGQKKLSEIVQKTQVPNLDVITSGPIPPNPSELIMSEAMKDLMEELKQTYDYIILDTPPVGLVTDAVELSQYSDVTLYITRQNFTKKEMIHVLNTRVQRGELNNVSIVLNGYENKARYGAGYGYGYGYGYGAYANGYHEEDKQENLITSTIKKFKNRFNKK